ncbi:hypothetical protein D3C86_1204740 [compost metagenome]
MAGDPRFLFGGPGFDGKISAFRGFWAAPARLPLLAASRARPAPAVDARRRLSPLPRTTVGAPNAPLCPSGPVPVVCHPGLDCIPRPPRGADPCRRRHRSGLSGGRRGVSLFLPAGHHGPDAAPVHPSRARNARRASQYLPARARPAPGRRRRALGQSGHAARRRLAGPDGRAGRAVRARHAGAALYADAAGHVDGRVRHAGQAQHRHGQGQYRDRAAGLDGHPAFRHGAHRRADPACLGEDPDPDRRSRRVSGRQRAAGRLPPDAAGAMEPAGAAAAREVGPEPGSEDLRARAGGLHAHRCVLHLRGGTATQAPAACHRPACAGRAAARRADTGPHLQLRQARPFRQARHAPRCARRARPHGSRCRQFPARRERLATGNSQHRRLWQFLSAARAGRPGAAGRGPARRPVGAIACHRQPGRFAGRRAPIRTPFRKWPVAARGCAVVAGGL